jgi:hypothetical protein
MTGGVSFVVPVRNGAAHLADVLTAIAAQADGRPMEILVVEDGSEDGSLALLRELQARYALRIIRGPRAGAAAAVNAGIRCATFPLIAQIDQDVVLDPGWTARLVAALDDPGVAAAQGRYVTDPEASLCARVMGLDLEQRYAALGRHVDHVCTGNTIYRAEALRAVGLLDETLGYGYDNDVSYRLVRAGYRLAICHDAHSHHRWREGLAGYVAQQYGFGYGRLDLIARHRSRWSGDAISPAGMMAHPLVMATAVGLVAAGALVTAGGGNGQPAWAAAAYLVAALALERAWAGGRAWRRFGDRAALAFPAVHAARDLAWVAALAVWSVRRLAGRPFRAAHSMWPRSVD